MAKFFWWAFFGFWILGALGPIFHFHNFLLVMGGVVSTFILAIVFTVVGKINSRPRVGQFYGPDYGRRNR